MTHEVPVGADLNEKLILLLKDKTENTLGICTMPLSQLCIFGHLIEGWYDFTLYNKYEDREVSMAKVYL